MRIFVAIDLPSEIKEELFQVAKIVSLGARVKLVEKENLHLTLLFLGNIESAKTHEVKDIVKENLIPGKIKLVLRELRLYGKSGKSEGVWVEVGGEKAKLFGLYKKLVDGFLKRGLLSKERIKFLPHITLYRFKKGFNKPAFLDLNLDFEADSLSLYQSKLTSKGPVYTKIAEFRLK
jgi:2'-5' RNA ligase